MSAGITKPQAEAIVTKLGATSKKSGRRKHLRFAVHVDGILWATIGYSHGKHNSNMNIPRELQIPFKETRQLALCQKSKNWYFETVRKKMKQAKKTNHERPADTRSGAKVSP